MLSIFKKDPQKKLTKEYSRLMKEARDIQRTGDLRLYAEKIQEAEELANKIEELKKQ